MPDSATRISRNNTSYAPTNPCKIYIKGKFATSPNHDAATTYYSKYRNHMTLNLYGPVSKIAYNGIKYLDTLLDTTTKWLDFRLLKIKGEALGAFKVMKTAVENQSSKKIKILRIDWGKEFINSTFNIYLTKCGILYKRSTPYTYKQNSAAKHVNQTILEKARCLLF